MLHYYSGEISDETKIQLPMNIAAYLANAAKAFADRPAISVGDRTVYTYRQLYERVLRLAAGLRAIPGVELGDRIALVMSNRPQYVELYYAIWHAGLCAVPVNAKLHPKEISFILDNCGVKACFATSDLAETVNLAAQDVQCVERVFDVDSDEYDALLCHEPIPQHPSQRDELAWIFYTSGTTGRPKGAMLSHQNLNVMLMSYLVDIDYLTQYDALLHLGPQSHAAGMFCLSHIAKGSNQVLPESGGFDESELVALIDHYPSSTFFVAPTMLRRLMTAPQMKSAKVDHIRTILCGAAPIYVEDVKRALNTFGPRFWNGYGQGEAPCTITAMPKYFYAEDQHPRFGARIASVGIARSGVEVRVVDDEDREVAAGEIGEIIVRGDVVMAGYWNNPDASAVALRNGWLHTGDLGTFDDDGFLTLKDRSKDLIISGGANIYPREIEEVLLTSAGVVEVAVVGRPDREWGEQVVAFVVAQGDHNLTADDLDAHCLANIARFKRPKQYVFVSELPKNNYGKVLKTELRRKAVVLNGDDFPADN